ncbi:P-loop containing nucleoside triphosphate hydrolase protein [Globomyces pollinis-pini]|nr:P-loop containing nucleoside triphosphate hydrolase protein [Globomyces pollinis-pini]
MQRLIKVVIIGDSGVGKTAIRTQYIHQKFTNQYRATIGVDFIVKNVIINDQDTDHQTNVSLQIWDTAGQERFHSLCSAFYRGADVCILVYDVTNPESLLSLSNWMRNFIYHSKIPHPQDFPFIILANKTDKVDDRMLTNRQGMRCAHQLKQLTSEIMEDIYRGSVIRAPTFDSNTRRNSVVEQEPRAQTSRTRTLQDSVANLKHKASFEILEHPSFKPTLTDFNDRNRNRRDSFVSFYTARSEVSTEMEITSIHRRKSIAKSEHTIQDDDESIDLEDSLPYFEVSAMNGTNIEQVFDYIAKNVLPPAIPQINIQPIEITELRSRANRRSQCRC